MTNLSLRKAKTNDINIYIYIYIYTWIFENRVSKNINSFYYFKVVNTFQAIVLGFA